METAKKSNCVLNCDFDPLIVAIINHYRSLSRICIINKESLHLVEFYAFTGKTKFG